MAKKFIYICLVFGFLMIPNIAQAALSAEDKNAIRKQVKTLEELVNDGQIEQIDKLISPKANSEMVTEIKEQLTGKFIIYKQETTDFEELGDARVKVSGKFAARGSNWNLSGLENYFIFEKVDEEWLLSDTDFYQKMSADYVFGWLKKFMPYVFILIVIAILLTIFWIFMVVDVVKRPIPNKMVWLFVLLIGGYFGAIIYYFLIKRQHNTYQVPTITSSSPPPPGAQLLKDETELLK